MSILISNDVFSSFMECRYKAHLMLAGKSGHKSDFENLEIRLLDDYRCGAEQHLLHSYSSTDIVQNPLSLSEARQHGYALITGGNVTADRMSCRFDALLRADQRSAPSAPEYLPVLFSRTDKISKSDKLLLAFCGLALADAQSKEVPIGKILHGPRFGTTKVHLSKLFTTTKRMLDEIGNVAHGTEPPPLRLNDHCSVCEFKKWCHAAAVDKDDLSLLRGLKEKEYNRLRSKGIFTVTQLSYTFRPRRRKSKRIAKHSPKFHPSLQALAIRANTIYVANSPKLPVTPTRLYLDIEGVPEQDFYYLIGLLVCKGSTSKYYPFWADQQPDEPTIWNAFLTAVGKYDDYTLFHYGAYDSRWFTTMEQRYGGDSGLLEKLREALFNTLSAIYSNVYFPVYSNDLKSIASFLGFRWSHATASGHQSIVWRHEWEAVKADTTRTELLRYNQEDCLALKVVTEALEQIGQHNSCNIGDGGSGIELTDDIKREHPFRFGRNPFFLPDMEWINRCAYFDYQRERVYIRTNERVKRSEKRKRRTKQATYRVNSEVVCEPPTSCPCCGGLHLMRYGALARVVYDLRFMKSGVKRWVVRYRSHRYQCKECGKARVPENYRSVAASHFGANLRAWCVYHTIALRQSHNSIRESVNGLVGYNFTCDIAGYVKKAATNYYRSTYECLLEDIRSGLLVHVDETRASIKGQVSYVWVFTNLEEVVYVFRPTREGSVLDEVLEGFGGVLVSDFYTAYDSVSCIHQKCLIHLMRDINDDLFKNPFDDGLKQIAQQFTATLRPIIETIDRYGLKKRHLNKHKSQAAKFLENVTGCTFSSEIAKGYQKRVRKNRDMLFTFLDYDGVPWNNNNAEHAIKRFAFLRKVIGGSSTQAGMEEYLILLSVYETLRLRGIGFLDFLVSGSASIDDFAAPNR